MNQGQFLFSSILICLDLRQSWFPWNFSVYTMSICTTSFFNCLVPFQSTLHSVWDVLGALQMFIELNFCFSGNMRDFIRRGIVDGLTFLAFCSKKRVFFVQYFSFFPSSSLPSLLSLTFPPSLPFFLFSTVLFKLECAFSHLLIQVIWSGSWEFAFWISSHARPVLLISRRYFELYYLRLLWMKRQDISLFLESEKYIMED